MSKNPSSLPPGSMGTSGRCFPPLSADRSGPAPAYWPAASPAASFVSGSCSHSADSPAGPSGQVHVTCNVQPSGGFEGFLLKEL